MAEQAKVIFVRIPPQEVLMRLSRVITDERQALFHPFATKTLYVGTIYSNGFRLRQNRSRAGCNGTVDWVGNASRISISFGSIRFMLAFLIFIAIFMSVVAIAFASIFVLLGAPAYTLIIAILGSLLLILLMIGIVWIAKSSVSSKQKSMVNYLEQVFQDVRIST